MDALGAKTALYAKLGNVGGAILMALARAPEALGGARLEAAMAD